MREGKDRVVFMKRNAATWKVRDKDGERQISSDHAFRLMGELKKEGYTLEDFNNTVIMERGYVTYET